MKLFNQIFRQPYLDAPDDLGGGSSEPMPNNEPTPNTDPNPTPSGTTEPVQTDFTPFLGALSEKLKFNHQPVKVESIDDVIANYQKGMNYEKAVEKAKQEATQTARDNFYAEQGYEWKGKKITTEAEYKQAIQESEKEKALIAKGIDPNALENEVNEHPAVKAAREQEQKNKVFAEFEKWHTDFKDCPPDLNKLPRPVIDAFMKGESMINAFMNYEYQANKAAKAKEVEAAKIQAANEKNAAGSTGSVKATAPAGGDFISFETFEQNKNDQRWVIKNLSKIQESRAKW